MSSPLDKTRKRKRSGDHEEQPCAKELPKTKKAPSLVDPQTIVTINVSNAKVKSKPFKVHKNYICYYSPYFDAAFNGKFVEGETQVLDLEDVDPKIFGVFVNWLYTQKVVGELGHLTSCVDCIHLWILADRFLMPTLQNHALQALERARIGGGSLTGSNTLHHIWENTPEDSVLRKYIVKCFVELLPGDIQKPERYPHQMLVSMFNMVQKKNRHRKGKPGGKPWEPSTEEMEKFFVSAEAVSVKDGIDPATSGGAATAGAGS